MELKSAITSRAWLLRGYFLISPALLGVADFGILSLLILLSGVSGFAQSIRVGPDGEFSEQTLSLPFAFYNDSFGLAVGYVYGVVGRPQKQATLLTTVMAGTKGSAMGFLIGRDLQMPRIDRLSLDPIISVGYFEDKGLTQYPLLEAGVFLVSVKLIMMVHKNKSYAK